MAASERFPAGCFSSLLLSTRKGLLQDAVISFLAVSLFENGFNVIP